MATRTLELGRKAVSDSETKLANQQRVMGNRVFSAENIAYPSVSWCVMEWKVLDVAAKWRYLKLP